MTPATGSHFLYASTTHSVADSRSFLSRAD